MAGTGTNYRFGPFLIDTARRELRRDGKEVVVQARAFDLLAYLATHHDRVIDKNELQDAVWPRRVITDAAMTRALMKARRAVGDSAADPTIIKTVHGKGYRFVANVEAIQAMPKAAAAPVNRRRVPAAVAAAAVVLAIIALMVWWPPVSVIDEDTRIAVLPLHDTTEVAEYGWTRLGLMSYAAGLIAADGKIPVVPESGAIRIADRFEWNGALGTDQSDEVIAKLHTTYGASHVLVMKLALQGNALNLNYSLLYADEIVAEGSFVGDEGTALVEKTVQAVYESLARGIRLGDQFPVVSKDPFNNEAFARGKSLSLDGRCAEAAQFFKVIIEHEPQLFEPRLEYAGCLRKLGEITEAEDMLVNLVNEQREISTVRPLGRTLMTLGVLYNRSGRLEEAEAAHGEALELALSVGDKDLAARTLQNMAIVAEDRSNWSLAEERLGRALLNYRESGREVIPGSLYSALSNIAMERGDYAAAESKLEQALASFRDAGDRRNEAMMLNNTGYLRRQQGRLDEAEDFHLRSLAIREEIGDRVGVGRIHGMLASVYTLKGQFDEAVTSAQSAIDIARETQDRLFEGTSLAQLADTEKALGNLMAARQLYEQAFDVFSGIGDRMRSQLALLKLASVDVAAGNLESAERAANNALKKSREFDLLSPEVQASELLGDIALARRDFEQAAARFQEALEKIREVNWDAREFSITHKLANAYIDLGDLNAAEPLIGYLVMGEPSARSHWTHARFAYARGDGAAAARYMEEAKTLAGAGWEESDEALLQSYKAAIAVVVD